MNRLNRWIKENGYTYGEAGAFSGWSAERMRRYAKGHRRPSCDDLAKIMQLTGLTADELMFGD
jgi:transcriptional regulator with XRE-family HTH domain